jgi:hypothetical protein
MQRWIDAKATEGKPAWLLVDDELLPADARTRAAGHWQYERRFIARSERPPSRGSNGEGRRIAGPG